MIDWALYVSLIWLVLIASITPGPNNFMLMSSGALFGFRRSLPHILGVAFGFPVLLLACVYGLGLLVENRPWLLNFVKIVGAFWMGWMAFKFFMAARHIARADTPAGEKNPIKSGPSRPFHFHEAALFQWANPKAVIMALTTSGLYVGITDNIHLRAIIMSGTFFLFALLATGIWTLVGSTLNRFMSEGLSALVLNTIMGLLLLATAIYILFV